jgi:hypothetical protein
MFERNTKLGIMVRDWRLYYAAGLIAFFLWRVSVTNSPIGLVLFGVSALLPFAIFLLAAASSHADYVIGAEANAAE